jgi:Tfp pilus assembly protein PilX
MPTLTATVARAGTATSAQLAEACVAAAERAIRDAMDRGATTAVIDCPATLHGAVQATLQARGFRTQGKVTTSRVVRPYIRISW